MNLQQFKDLLNGEEAKVEDVREAYYSFNTQKSYQQATVMLRSLNYGLYLLFEMEEQGKKEKTG